MLFVIEVEPARNTRLGRNPLMKFVSEGPADSIEIREGELVEARGVEPLSENVTSKETTCLVGLLPWAITPQRSPRALRADKKREWLACLSRPHPQT